MRPSYLLSALYLWFYLLPFSFTVRGSGSVHVFSCDCMWNWCLFRSCCYIQHTMFGGMFVILSPFTVSVSVPVFSCDGIWNWGLFCFCCFWGGGGGGGGGISFYFIKWLVYDYDYMSLSYLHFYYYYWLLLYSAILRSWRILCTPYNHAPHFMQSHICKVYACLVVTCHLHFWQNDRGLLHATAVTQG